MVTPSPIYHGVLANALVGKILTSLFLPLFHDVAESAASVGHRQGDKQPISVTEPGQLSPDAHITSSLPGSEGGSDVLSSPSELLAPVDVTQLTPQSTSQDLVED